MAFGLNNLKNKYAPRQGGDLPGNGRTIVGRLVDNTYNPEKPNHVRVELMEGSALTGKQIDVVLKDIDQALLHPIDFTLTPNSRFEVDVTTPVGSIIAFRPWFNPTIKGDQKAQNTAFWDAAKAEGGWPCTYMDVITRKPDVDTAFCNLRGSISAFIGEDRITKAKVVKYRAKMLDVANAYAIRSLDDLKTAIENSLIPGRGGLPGNKGSLGFMVVYPTPDANGVNIPDAFTQFNVGNYEKPENGDAIVHEPEARAAALFEAFKDDIQAGLNEGQSIEIVPWVSLSIGKNFEKPLLGTLKRFHGLPEVGKLPVEAKLEAVRAALDHMQQIRYYDQDKKQFFGLTRQNGSPVTGVIRFHGVIRTQTTDKEGNPLADGPQVYFTKVIKSDMQSGVFSSYVNTRNHSNSRDGGGPFDRHPGKGVDLYRSNAAQRAETDKQSEVEKNTETANAASAPDISAAEEAAPADAEIPGVGATDIDALMADVQNSAKAADAGLDPSLAM